MTLEETPFHIIQEIVEITLDNLIDVMAERAPDRTLTARRIIMDELLKTCAYKIN